MLWLEFGASIDTGKAFVASLTLLLLMEILYSLVCDS